MTKILVLILILLWVAAGMLWARKEYRQENASKIAAGESNVDFGDIAGMLLLLGVFVGPVPLVWAWVVRPLLCRFLTGNRPS